MLKKILKLLETLLLFKREHATHQSALEEITALQKGNLDPDEKEALQGVLDIVSAYHECAYPAQAPSIEETGHPLPVIPPTAINTGTSTEAPAVPEGTEPVTPNPVDESSAPSTPAPTPDPVPEDTQVVPGAEATSDPTPEPDPQPEPHAEPEAETPTEAPAEQPQESVATEPQGFTTPSTPAAQ